MNIGLIAGGGQFPGLFSRHARKKGYQIFAVGFINEASEDLGNHVDEISWMHLGQVSRLLKFFKMHGVNQAVMLGTIKKTNIFRDIKPDFKALAFLAKQQRNHDDSILSSFAGFLESHGIKIMASTFLIPELLCEKGCWTKRKPDKSIKKDINEGWKITKEIGKLDIGQSIVMSNGSVLAVEGADGTDATIKRGAMLAKNNGAVVIKLSKPGQDLRFDLPTVGLQTVETMNRYGADILVLEAGKTICFDKDSMIEFADAHNMSILVMSQDDIL